WSAKRTLEFPKPSNGKRWAGFGGAHGSAFTVSILRQTPALCNLGESGVHTRPGLNRRQRREQRDTHRPELPLPRCLLFKTALPLWPNDPSAPTRTDHAGGAQNQLSNSRYSSNGMGGAGFGAANGSAIGLCIKRGQIDIDDAHRMFLRERG